MLIFPSLKVVTKLAPKTARSTLAPFQTFLMRRVLFLFSAFLPFLFWGAVLAADPYQDALDFHKGELEAILKRVTLQAEQGDADAQARLGLMYWRGFDVPKDLKLAIKWYTLATDQGHAEAQFRLGKMILHGSGIERDQKRGLEMYALSADRGYALAQYRLGLLYHYGMGELKPDLKIAFKWYLRVAKQGIPFGQNRVGEFYAKGLGVRRDNKAAIRWFTLAAEQGRLDAQLNLGVAYEKGDGTPQDYVRSLMWYNIVSSRTGRPWHKKRAALAEKMTPADIAQAQKLAYECRQQYYRGC